MFIIYKRSVEFLDLRAGDEMNCLLIITTQVLVRAADVRSSQGLDF